MLLLADCDPDPQWVEPLSLGVPALECRRIDHICARRDQREDVILHGPLGRYRAVGARVHVVPIAVAVPIEPHIHIGLPGRYTCHGHCVLDSGRLAGRQDQGKRQTIIGAVLVWRVIEWIDVVDGVLIRADVRFRLQTDRIAQEEHAPRLEVDRAIRRRAGLVDRRIVRDHAGRIRKHRRACDAVRAVRGVPEVLLGLPFIVPCDDEGHIERQACVAVLVGIDHLDPAGSARDGIDSIVIPAALQRRCLPPEGSARSRGGTRDRGIARYGQPVDGPLLLLEGVVVDAEVVLEGISVIVRQIAARHGIVPSLGTVVDPADGVLAGMERPGPQEAARPAPTVGGRRDVRVDAQDEGQIARALLGQDVCAERSPEVDVVNGTGFGAFEVVGQGDLGQIDIHSCGGQVGQLRPVHLVGFACRPVAGAALAGRDRQARLRLVGPATDDDAVRFRPDVRLAPYEQPAILAHRRAKTNVPAVFAELAGSQQIG